MGWTALAFLVLGLSLGALAIRMVRNARAPDVVGWAIMIAIGAGVSLLTAIVLGVLAALG